MYGKEITSPHVKERRERRNNNNCGALKRAKIVSEEMKMKKKY